MATHAFGTKLKWNANYVASINTINGIEISADTVEVTTHDSPDAYKEYIPGLLDAGDVAVEGYFNATDTDGQIAMLTDMNARQSRSASIEFPASIGASWTFDGLITSLKIGDAPVDGAIPFTATIKVTSKPVLAVSASTGLTTPFVAISEGAVVVPTPSGSVYNYVATVLTDVESVTVTPTAATGVIKVNGNTVVSGEASSAIALGDAGSITTITITVTEENKSPKNYTIQVVRAAS